MLHYTVPLEFHRSSLAQSGEFEGICSAFGVVDHTGDVIKSGAFAASLAEHARAGTRPALLWQHDPTAPAGTWLELRENERGLHGRGKLALGTERGREAHELLKSGAIDGLSIGFNVPEGGYTMRSGVRELHRIELWEVSLVTFPANTRARVTDVKSLDVRGNVRHFETALREQLGFNSREAKALATAHRLLRGNDQSHDEGDELTQLLRGFSL